MLNGVAAAVPLGAMNSETAPAVVILPIFPTCISVNQRFPSGPFVIIDGAVRFDASEYSVITPVGVIFPTFPLIFSVNQTLPSGPEVIAEWPNCP